MDIPYYLPQVDDLENSVDLSLDFSRSMNMHYGLRVTNPGPHGQEWNSDNMTVIAPHFVAVSTAETEETSIYPVTGSGFQCTFEVDNDFIQFPPYAAHYTPFDTHMITDSNTTRPALNSQSYNNHYFPTTAEESTITTPVSEEEGSPLTTDRHSRSGWSARRAETDSRFTPDTPLVCKWAGCKYRGSFQRRTELMRHLECIHVFPNGYPCPAENCCRSFNRRDNLEEHLKKAHPDIPPRTDKN